MAKRFLYFVLVLIFLSFSVSAQPKEKSSTQNTQNTKNGCRVFLNGKLLNNPQPVYPKEAKIAGIAGKIEVVVEIDSFGNVVKVESTNGNEILAKAASEAAKQAVFSPTMCDGRATKNVGIITFNFAPVELTKQYYQITRINEFSDINSESNFYEPLLYLAENYRIAFGYADQKFHGEMLLTKGDFAHFLRQTLQMLDWRGKLANKNPAKIGLYQSFNPHNLKEIEFNPTAPYSESIKILLDKYGIVLANEDGNFAGDSVMSKGEIIRIWRRIFDDEAIPVNFLTIKNQDEVMTRGDFAIYLKESLDVLTYKILP
ncbi:MAG: energy transducer TonB [Pyrinomonadaceae bacterium]|nr:energy transducer TonB [Pyrinomonadaceae bacterium]